MYNFSMRGFSEPERLLLMYHLELAGAFGAKGWEIPGEYGSGDDE